jgi:hypothetical protein
VPGQRLGHLGREAGLLQAGDEQVAVAVEIGEQAVAVAIGQEIGLFALAIINKSLANTTLSITGYFVDDSVFAGNNDAWSIWASAVGNVDGVKWGVQIAYVDSDQAGARDTLGIAGKIGSSWGDFDAQLVAGWINNGTVSLRTAGAGGLGGTPSAFWTFNGDFGGDVAGDDVWSIGLNAGYKLQVGKIFGKVGYWDADGGAAWSKAWDYMVGYKFKIADINAQVEYRYLDQDYRAGNDDDRHRIRVQAYYKF